MKDIFTFGTSPVAIVSDVIAHFTAPLKKKARYKVGIKPREPKPLPNPSYQIHFSAELLYFRKRAIIACTWW